MSNESTFEILLVEDNDGDAELTVRALSRTTIPHRVTIATDGDEAVQHLQDAVDAQLLPHLILLDLNLPTLSGFEVLSFIKSHPRLRRIPVVVLSSSDAEVDVRRCYDGYANSYVTKKIGLAEFTNTLIETAEHWTSVATVPGR